MLGLNAVGLWAVDEERRRLTCSWRTRDQFLFANLPLVIQVHESPRAGRYLQALDACRRDRVAGGLTTGYDLLRERPGATVSTMSTRRWP